MKMKWMSKLLSLVLCFALITPMTAYANAADLTKITVKGKELTIAASALYDDVATAKENTLELELSSAQILSDAGIVVTETEEDSIILIVSGGDDSTITDASTNITASSPDLTIPLDVGDVIWIKDGTTSPKLLRILIKQTGGGSITGDSVVKEAVLNVVLPLSLDFTVDPLQITPGITPGSQIATTDYRIANKSEVDVNVTFDIAVTVPTAGTPAVPTVTLVDSPAELSKDDPTVTAKEVYFAVLGAKSITGTPTFGDLTQGTMTYSAGEADAKTIHPVDSLTKSADISFLLGKATDTGSTGSLNTLAANNAGVASFQFYGELNSYADWAADDLTVTGTYSIQGVRAADYTAIKTATGDASNIAGLNIYTKRFEAVEFDVRASVDAIRNVTLSRALVSGPISADEGDVGTIRGINILLADKPNVTAAGITIVNAGNGAGFADFTYDQTTGLLNLTTIPALTNGVLRITTGTGQTAQLYYINFVLTDN